jgi:hypothetical protein
MSTLSDGGGRGFFVMRKHGRSRGAAAHLRWRRLFFEPLEQRALLDGLGVIAGTVFEDLDRDGICDLGEPGLAGWTVELQPAGGATGLVQSWLNPASGDSDLYGRCVAAADGKTLVGAPGDDTGASDAGVAYLFDASGALPRTFENPEPAAGDQFGSAVAMVGGAPCTL